MIANNQRFELTGVNLGNHDAAGTGIQSVGDPEMIVAGQTDDGGATAFTSKVDGVYEFGERLDVAR